MSPYRLKGKTVYKKVNGLKKKGTSKSASKAKRYLNLLRGVEHGWRPTRSAGRKRRRK